MNVFDFFLLMLLLSFGLIIAFLLAMREGYEVESKRYDAHNERLAATLLFDDLTDTAPALAPKEESTQELCFDESVLEDELEGALFEAIERYLDENPPMSRWHRNIANRLSWEHSLNRPEDSHE